MIFLFALILSFVVTGLVSKFGKYFGILDDPQKHKLPKVIHTIPVPRGGGIPIFLAVCLGLLIFIGPTTKVLGITTACLLLTVIGVLDDLFEEKVSPYLRLLINIAASFLVVLSGIGISYITNPLGGILNLPWYLADTFALVWLVWMQNIIGWSSGVDGQLPGFVIIAAITMASLSGNSQIAIVLATLTAGAYLGFLPWNWYPQKIMPGYGGKSLAGFLLGVLAILSSAKVGALILVLGIPFLDAVRVIIKRISEGRSPVWGGREHFHHFLLDLGWGKRRIAIFYWVVSALLAILALNLNSRLKYFTMATGTLLFFGAFAWWNYWLVLSKRPGLASGSKTSLSSGR